MAQDVVQHDIPEEVVYDSQEEDDQWPDFQSIVRDTVPSTSTPKRSQVLKVYGRPKDPDRQVKSVLSSGNNEGSKGLSLPSLTSPSEPSLANTDNVHRKQQAPPVPSPPGSEERLQGSENAQKEWIRDFESSDDDLPLLPTFSSPRPHPSSIPIPSATVLEVVEPAHAPSLETVDPSEPSSRALRARKPEQRMPYTLDLIRHRDQFRRRGLQPVHNPSEQSHTNANDDDQYQADDDEIVNELGHRSPSPREVHQHTPKRRRIQRNDEEEEQMEIRLKPGRRKFLDPRQFDVRREPEAVQQLTPEQEVSHGFDFSSDDDFGFFPAPSSPPLLNLFPAQVRSPRQTVTPISNSNEPSSPNPIPTRISINHTIPLSNSSSDSESSSSSVQRRLRRHIPPPSSTSSASSDAEAIERLKKKARGVLPGSFFTVRSVPLPKASNARPTTNNHDQERRGVAKTKVNHTIKTASQFAFQANSSSDDDERRQSREKRNFVDLTREETIQNDVDGWDIEEDLIDRMLGWGGRHTSNRSQKTTLQRKKNKVKNAEMQQKPKRQRRINEFTVPTSTTLKTATKKKKSVRLSIVDACDVFSAQGGRSLPQFMKIARRQSKCVKNYGRRKAPGPERFSFAEDVDQEDVNTVIEEWKTGTIAEGLERRPWKMPIRTPGVSRSSVRRPDGISRTDVKRIPLAPLAEENATNPDTGKKPVDRFIRPGAPIIAIVDGSKSRGRIVQLNAARPTGQIEGIAKVRVPTNTHVRPRRPNDIVNWLKASAEQSRSNIEEDPDEMPEFMDISSPPLQPPTKLRLRKPNKPKRREINMISSRPTRITSTDADLAAKSQQLSLDDIWFSNDSSSLTFGVVAIPEGAYLNAKTFIGRGLLSMAFKTQVAMREDSNLWTNVQPRSDFDVEQACERIGTELDTILSSIDQLRLFAHAESAATKRIHDQILTFGEFIVSSLADFRPAESTAIQIFGSKTLRLATMALDHLDGDLLSGALDLSDPSVLLPLSVVQVLLVNCYQLCLLTSRDVSMIEAEEMLVNLSQHLLQYLLRGGLDAVQHTIRRIRAKSTTNASLECDSILIDVWSTLYILLTKKDERLVVSFWGLVRPEFDVKETMDWKLLDRTWNTVFNISAITTLDVDGIARAPTHHVSSTPPTTIWNIVEALIAPCLQSYSTAQHHRYDAYIRILFGRCFTLISTWGWYFGAKTVLTTMYTFFTERRFDNLKTEGFGGFPKFFQSTSPLEVQTTDSTFVLFLKVLASYITQQQSHLRGTSKTDRRQFLAASKDLDRFVNRVTPLRTYQSEFAPLDYIALQNHYCLLLTLYWVAPGRSRPSIERIRDVIDIEKAPAPAQVICLETWTLLTELQLKKDEEITSSIEWFLVIFRHSLKEYQEVSRPANVETEFFAGGQAKSKIRALESILLKALGSLENVLPLAAQKAGQLVEDITGPIVKSSHQLPSSVMRALLAVLKAFFTAMDKATPVPQAPVLISLDQDSQDYGDAAFLEEYMDAQDNASVFPAKDNLSKICSHLHQVVANLFTSFKPTADDLGTIIDTWIAGVSIAVRHGLRDWKAFLQYGGEWERLRSTNSQISRQWSPYILTRVLSADPNAYFTEPDQFISAWFESIVEPEVEQQCTFTAVLLNIEDEHTILRNPLLTKNSEGVYAITPEALFEARPSLVVYALANMGKAFDNLAQAGDRITMSLHKQKYIDYLHRMLSSMKSIYLDMANTESEVLVQYISLAQHVVGNIIQHCAPFLKESHRTFEDLPILDFFTSGETFPQPGANEVTYAAQRLRGSARKDSRRPFSNGTQMDIFWSIKSFLEKSVRNNRQRDFVGFCVTSFCEGNEDRLGDHVAALRMFVMQDIVSEYFRLATEAPEITNPAWGYVLPCLAAVREVYVCIWDGLTRDNVRELKGFMEEILGMLLVMHAMLAVIAYQLDEHEFDPYMGTAAGVFDFVIFVNHMLFFLKDVTHVQEQVQDLSRIAHVFQLMAAADEVPWSEREWVEEITSTRVQNGYIASTVWKELLQGLPYEVGNVSRTKMDEIRSTLSGSFPNSGFERAVEMYV